MAGPDFRPANVLTGRSHAWRAPSHGFTMVELIVVLVLTGILGAIGVARFFDRPGFDADAFTEQARAMLRYAQKMAIAQNRPVYVQLDGGGISLCFSDQVPCGAQVSAPAGNTGSKATSQYCNSSNWYCEGTPQGVTYTVAGASHFYFDPLGRPLQAPGAAFPRLTMTVTGGGTSRQLGVEPETGYVF